jgi:uncharacterized phage-like protein YoqJ
METEVNEGEAGFHNQGKKRLNKANRETERKMQAILDTLGVPLTVVWVPDTHQNKHGEIKSSTIFIYSPSESDAWNTFTHEVVEFKFKDVTSTYRAIINTLIEALEKLVYERKEQFIEFLPKLFEVIREEKSRNCTP